MQCFHPITAWKAKTPNDSGKTPIIFNWNKATCDREIKVACGKCHGCRLTKSVEWAVRCTHEAKLHEDNMFLTLTYNPEHLPYDAGLHHKHFQKFLKRYRKYISPKKIRFFMCGEYGEQPIEQNPVQHLTQTIVGKTKRRRAILGRPHYHAAIFGHQFDDLEHYKTDSSTGKTCHYYTSKTLNNLWGMGYVVIGELNMKTAAYIARYTTKKLTGEQYADHYQKINTQTGEHFDVKPEYTQASRRPGLGHHWWQQFKTDTFKDSIHIQGEQYKVPKYYDRLLEKLEPFELEAIKEARSDYARLNQLSESRLATMEEIYIRKTSTLKRNKNND